MVYSRRKLWALAACTWLFLPASAATLLPDTQAPIVLDAESSEYDRNRDRLLFRRVRITQGGLSIVADQAEANALDFAASTWEFLGHVEVDGQGARIRASSATILFSNHRLVRATAEGEPATFERDATPDLRALSGNAEIIDYDVPAAQLALRGGARLVDGPNRFDGHELIYHVEEDRVAASASSEGGQQVTVRISPSTIENADEADAREAEAPEADAPEADAPEADATEDVPPPTPAGGQPPPPVPGEGVPPQ